MIPLEISINITGDQIITCINIIVVAWIVVTLFKNMS